jgi:hypothetical protein
MSDPEDDEFEIWLKSNPPLEEIEERLQRLAEEFPEEFEKAYAPKQPFGSSTRPFDVFEYRTGGWGVVLSVGSKLTTVGRFATREAALAYVAEHAPRNG